MALTGKGFMIWKIKDCEGGNADAIADVARRAGLSHVLIKVVLSFSSPVRAANFKAVIRAEISE